MAKQIWMPQLWPGCTVFILGGGPSLTQSDVDKLRGKKVIAINNAYTLAPWAQILYFMDCKWWDWNEDKLKSFGGIKVSVCEKLRGNSKGVLVLERTKDRLTIPTSRRQLATGTNSGYGAMVLAVMMGASRIVLLGFDMKRSDDGRNNFHDDHKLKVVSPTRYSRVFNPFFKRLKEQLDEEGIECFNATVDSDLKDFPFKGIDQCVAQYL